MMLPTHVLFGISAASLLLWVAPAFSSIALLAAVAGSIFPDLDMVFQHRRTLHYPVYYSLFSVPFVVAAVLYPAPATLFAAVFMFSAALHAVSDIFGCGLETRPWEATDDRGVYSHYHGRWIRPRRWIPYDGSPQDFGLSLVFGLLAYGLYDGVVQPLVLIILGIAAVYVLSRKRLADLDERLGHPIPTIGGD